METTSKTTQKASIFDRMASYVTKVTGSSSAFLIALAVVVVWAATVLFLVIPKPGSW